MRDLAKLRYTAFEAGKVLEGKFHGKRKAYSQKKID